ncbi:hypothetical protein ACFLQ8_02350 [Candidatus Auribacterota bacterium]
MMEINFPGIGIVFDIDRLGGGYYGYRAWEIFMKYLPADKIRNTILREGDTNATLAGKANDFCIAVYGPVLDVKMVRDIFAGLNDDGLAVPEKRIIECPELNYEPLPIRGRVNDRGCFISDEWMRIDHDLCKGAGWKYGPEKVPDDLPDDLKLELEKMGE